MNDKFREAAAKTARMALEEKQVFYLYRGTNGEYLSSHKYWKDWLFLAYPGGRKELSIAGKKEMEKPNEQT